MISDKQYSVLVAVIGEGKKQRQAGQALNMNQSSVSRFMARLRKKSIGELLDKMEQETKKRKVTVSQYKPWMDDQVIEQF